MKLRIRIVLSLLMLVAFSTAAGCSGAVPSTTRSVVAVAPPSVVTLTSSDAIDIELRAPTRVRWVPATLGPSKPTLGVLVTNHGTTPVDVSNLRAYLVATREGVAFRCATSVGAAPEDVRREPSILPPNGGSFLFERALDCALPLTGSYAISVGVSFGAGAGAGAATTPRLVRSFSLTVDAPGELEPKPVSSMPGVWAAIGASPFLDSSRGGGGSSSSSSSSSAAGRIAVSIVNSSPLLVPVPRLRIAFRVFRAGSPIPCVDEPIDLRLPPTRVIEPGKALRETIEVSCLGLGVPGKYEVATRLLVGESDETTSEVDLGRLRIKISADRSLFLYPWPSPP